MNNKRTNIIVCVILVIGSWLIWLAQTPSQAQSRSNRQPEAIYLNFKPTPGPRVTNEFGINTPEVGLEVKWVSRSQTAPEIPVGYPAGEVIAFLHGQGYALHWLSADKVVGVK